MRAARGPSLSSKHNRNNRIANNRGANHLYRTVHIANQKVLFKPSTSNSIEKRLIVEGKKPKNYTIEIARILNMATAVKEFVSAPPTGKKAVLLFWAPWHEASVEGGPMDQVLKTLASANNGLNDIVFGRVQAEGVASLTEKYGVTSVPTFVMLDTAGNVINRIEAVEDVASVTQAVQALASSPAVSAPSSSLSTNSAQVSQMTPEQLLTQQLDKLIRASDVMLFMKGVPGAPKCGFSRQAVELLEQENIPFGSFDILSDDEVRQGLKKHSNWPTYPQLYANGELIGGLDILKELKTEGPSLREQLGISEDKVAKPAETLEERLKKLVNRHKVMLFMKGLPSAPKCGFSQKMVQILDDMGMAYDSFNILEDEEIRQGLKQFSDWPTYPQLYANGELIGGLDICKELAESGELDAMLE